jgi:hypothetical protein
MKQVESAHAGICVSLARLGPLIALLSFVLFGVLGLGERPDPIHTALRAALETPAEQCPRAPGQPCDENENESEDERDEKDERNERDDSERDQLAFASSADGVQLTSVCPPLRYAVAGAAQHACADSIAAHAPRGPPTA